jgi:hypothetical protein
VSNNVTVDFTTNVQSVDPLGVGLVLSEFGGNPIPFVGNSGWNTLLTNLAPGHMRASLAWYGGNPGYGAGGSSRTPGTGAPLIAAIKATGAIPLISFNGDSSDNGFKTADAGSIVHYFNDNGGQHNGPVRYWSVGNEAGNSAPYTSSSGDGSAPAALSAMKSADGTINVGLPAAPFWDTNFLTWAAGVPGLNALSYHAYDGADAPGSDNGGGGFYDTSQYYRQTGTMRQMKAGVLYGVEEFNWNSQATAAGTIAAMTSWKGTVWIADVLGQLLASGAHGTVYSDSNAGLSIISDGFAGLPAFGTPMPAYWGIGIWTGMSSQFKRYSANVVSASTTFPNTSVSVYACDNGKIVVINKATSAQALTIGLTLAGGKTSGTYDVWASNMGSPTSAITHVVTAAAFSGSVISYTIPAGTAVSIDVTGTGGGTGGGGGGTGVALSNNLESGSDGTAITTANSPSPNAFDSVAVTGGGAAAFSATQKAHGSLSLAVSTTATAGVANVTWGASLGASGQATLYGRAYVFLTGHPPSDTNIIKFSGTAGAFGGGVMIANSGQLRIQNVAFGEVAGGPTIPTGQWVRLEYKVVCGAAGAASCTVNYYASADSTTITNTLADTAGGYGAGGVITAVAMGWNDSTASQPSMYLDDLAVSTSGYLGPTAGALSNTFEGGANGTAITPANSGGASGSAFDAVSTATGAVAAYSSGRAAEGTLSALFSTNAIAGVAVVEWNSTSLGAGWPVLFGRACVNLSAYPSGADNNVAKFAGASGARGGGIMIASSGQLRIQNAAFGEVPNGPTIPLNQWVRLEWQIVCGAAGAASATLRYYDAIDAATPAATLTDSAGQYGAGGVISDAQFGWTVGLANQPQMWLDAIGLSPSGYLGPLPSVGTKSPQPLPISLPSLPPRQPWRFLYGPRAPQGGFSGAIEQASARRVTLRAEPDQNSQVAWEMDGRDPAAAAITELETDVTVMYGSEYVFAGRVGPSQDVIDAAAHRTQFTAYDYRDVLRRQLLLPGDTLTFVTTEQQQIAWDLIKAAQAHAGANLGIVQGLGAAGSGVTRNMTFANGDYIGDDISTMAGLDNGFEWLIQPYGPGDLRFDFYYPKMGKSTGRVFALGMSRVQSITRVVDTSTYADAVYVTGDPSANLTAQSLAAAGVATSPQGRWDQVIGSTMKTATSLSDYATRALSAAQVIVPAYTIVLQPGSWMGIDDVWLGDTVNVQVRSGRLNVNDQLRVVEMDFALDADNLEILTLTVGAIPLQVWRLIPKMLKNLALLNTR